MTSAAAAAAVSRLSDGEEMRVPGSPQPYARRVRGSWRDYLEPPADDVANLRDLYGFHDEYDDRMLSDDDGSCCSMCSSGAAGGRDTSSSVYSSSSSSSSASSLSVPRSRTRPSLSPLQPVFEPFVRGSCRCIRCQKRRYSLDFFKSTDFRRGVPSPNVYMIDERASKIVHDYIHGNYPWIYVTRPQRNFGRGLYIYCLV